MTEFACYRDGRNRIACAADKLTPAEICQAQNEWEQLRVWLLHRDVPFEIAIGVFAAMSYKCTERMAVERTRDWFRLPRVLPAGEAKVLQRASAISSCDPPLEVLSRVQYCLYNNLLSPQMPYVVVNPQLFSIWQGELTLIGQGEIDVNHYRTIQRAVLEIAEILTSRCGVIVYPCDLQRALCAQADRAIGQRQMDLDLS